MPNLEPQPACRRCGTLLSPSSTGALCPACLLRAAMTESEVVLPPPVRCEGFILLEEVGRGGSGSVWRAVQQDTGATVAIKILLEGPLATESQRRRFLHEATISRQLAHPGIIATHELRETDGTLFLVMDFVEGESLAARFRGDPVPHRELAVWVRRLADAVAYAHRCGVLHRDLKPGNVLIDATGRPRILDFGLATPFERPVDSSLTSSGAGTLSYLAPEQVLQRHKPPDKATDVHGLGGILYHGLTGRPPYVGEDPPAVFRSIAELDVPSPRYFVPTVPAALETICLKCLRKEPSRRYASAEELCDDLDRFLAGSPIRAQPMGRLERMWRWCRRRPLAATLAVSSAAAVALLLV